MADWFAISLRWVALLGLIVSLGIGDKLQLSISWPLALLIIWNLVMTAFAGINIRMPYHRPISIFVELVLTGIFFWTQGGLRGPAVWTGLLPILTSSIYFELLGAIIISLLFSGLMIFTGMQVEGDFPIAVIISITLILLSLVFGFLGQRMILHLRKNRTLWQDSEEKKGAMQAERMRAIYELTTTLSSTLSYKRVLESALNMSVAALNPDPEQLHADPLAGAVMLFNLKVIYFFKNSKKSRC